MNNFDREQQLLDSDENEIIATTWFCNVWTANAFIDIKPYCFDVKTILIFKFDISFSLFVHSYRKRRVSSAFQLSRTT